MNIKQYAEQNGFSLRRAGGKYYLGLALGDVVCRSSSEVRATIDSEVAERKQHGKRKSPERTSPKGACRIVWDICDNMPDAPRKEIIAVCLEAGIHKGTASTQYAKWKRACKGTK